jgi:site-specific recombinase XerD
VKISETEQDFDKFLRVHGKILTTDSRKKYWKIMKQFVAFTEDKEIHDIAVADFGNFKDRCYLSGNKSSTIATALSIFVKYALYLKADHGINLDTQEMKNMRPIVEQDSPQYINRDAVTSLVMVAKRDEDVAIVELLFNTGIRIQELTGILLKDITDRTVTIHDIPTIEHWLKVRGKGRKKRDIPLNSVAYQALSIHLENLKETDLSVRIFKKTYACYFKRLKRMGRITGIKISPHVLRHSFGTALNEKDISLRNIADLMGHESMTTTVRYTKVMDKAKVAAVNALV